MEKHLELNDKKFLNQMISCKLDPSIFTHEAHLRLAWINIRKYGIEQAISEIQSQLLKFVNYVGEKDKYNITLTVAAARIVNHFMQRSNSNDFSEFATEFPRLKTDFKGLIDSHYSVDIFKSAKVKTNFLEPDLLPFS